MLRTFSRIENVFVALVVSAFVFIGTILIQTLPLVLQIASLEKMSYTQMIATAVKLSISTVFELPPAEFAYLVSISILIGINAALMVFFVRIYRTKPTNINMAAGLAGTVSALFGIGCAACGSLIITSIFGVTVGSTVAFLPFGGTEIGVVGVCILAATAFVLARSINKPLVCPV